MANSTLQLSKVAAYATSSWTGTYSGNGNYSYSAPTLGTDTVTVTVPSALSGATFTSAILSYDTKITAAGSRYIRFTDTNELVTNASLLARMQSGASSFGLKFTFQANGGTGKTGSHQAQASWTNIAITVTYTAMNGIVGTVTITSAGTATYSLDIASLANGENALLSVYAQPTTDITGIAVSIRPGTLTAGEQTYSVAKSIAANSSGSCTFAISLDTATVTAMTSRVYSAQIRITFTASNGTQYASSWTNAVNTSDSKAFKLLKTRSAPVISGITWSESGTTHISTFGHPVQGKTLPVLSFSVALDTSADTGISVGSREVMIDGKTYSPGTNSVSLSEISASGSVAFSISVTDSYGQTGTYSGTVTVLAYTPPSLTGLDICRYTGSLDSGGNTVYTADDDGNRLWFDGSISVQTVLGSGSNPWSLTITPSGSSAITAVNGSTTASVTYTHERSFLSGTFSNATSYDFTVTLSDQLTSRTYEINVPKAGGYFNIEKAGVAVGMRSTGTEETPLFQSAYPAYFLGGIYGANGDRIDAGTVDDTGWQSVTLTACTAFSSDTPVYARKKNGVVFVKGAIKLNNQLGSYAQGNTTRTQIGTLPMGMNPSGSYQFSIVADARYLKLVIETDGKMYLMNHCGSAVGTSLKISLVCSFLVD